MIKFHSKSQRKISYFNVYNRYFSQVVQIEFKSAQNVFKNRLIKYYKRMCSLKGFSVILLFYILFVSCTFT